MRHLRCALVLFCLCAVLTSCGDNTAAQSALPTQQASAPTMLATTPPTALPTSMPMVVPTSTSVPPTSTPVPPPAPTVEEAPAPATGTRYVFPVQSNGKINYGQYHHDYPATDIFCPIGSQFVAPTSGTVDWISYEDTWDPATDDPAVRGGRSVAIVGDDGVRYYGSHLSAIADGLRMGQRVEGGQLLGLTGNSGDARFTPSHLHFGISHPTTSDDWQTRRGEVSPFSYLNAWRNGEMITPNV